jgi:hypothetical protein
MSNVLIGIIGVILFIGLALAGALFLGPRFQESANNSKGSAAIQAVAQIASAANMANVQLGTPVAVGTDTPATLQTAQYLKAVPSNPVTGGAVATLVDGSGATTGGGAAAFVVMGIGTNQSVCDAVARQSGVTGGAATVATFTTANVAGVSGCVRSTTAVGGAAANDYVVFAKI